MNSGSRSLRHTFERCRAETRAALITYLAAGDPIPEATEELVKGAVRGGADIIEIGLPFSDPLADGPIIQAAYTRSLDGGTTVRSALNTVGEICTSMDVPVVLMTSWNPVLAYGPERFCEAASAKGAAGVLVPDLLPEDSAPFRQYVQGLDLDMVYLAAPGMSEKRLQAAAAATTGFLYLISRRGVTGPKGGVGEALEDEVERARQFCNQPIAVGFGVATPRDATRVARCADGVVVGSALVEEAWKTFERVRLGTTSEERAILEAADAVAHRTAELHLGLIAASAMEGQTEE